MNNDRPDFAPEENGAHAAPPEILAPAGNREAFLAGVAAGSEALYCGLKRYSARMQAPNFTVEELAALTRLAHEKGSRVYVAFNSLIRPGEIAEVHETLARLVQRAAPDALIFQDLAVAKLARHAGFRGQLHLSTLAHAGTATALKAVRQGLGIDRVVLPRELDIDEIKSLAAVVPPGLGLEVFVHGALCYGISGRCYWSSHLGGRSGLRGQCVP